MITNSAPETPSEMRKLPALSANFIQKSELKHKFNEKEAVPWTVESKTTNLKIHCRTQIRCEQTFAGIH